MNKPNEPPGILTTLYATKFIVEPSLAHLRTEELVKHLQKRLEEGEGIGAIRVHLLCDLSHV